MKDLKVWVRMGDRDDYHSFETPYDAGYEIGLYYDLPLADIGGMDFMPNYCSRFGCEMIWFEGANYISLFWGDNDAQDATKLNASDRLDFEQGIRDGLAAT